MAQNYALIWKAVKLAGSQKNLASILEVPPSNVNRWVSLKTPVPAKHAHAIETWSEGKIKALSLLNASEEDNMSDLDKSVISNSKQIDELFKKAKLNDIAINIYIGLDETAYIPLAQ